MSPLSQQQKIYIQRINRAIDFIEGNIQLDLSLAQIADAASFSSFHFHRIFKAMTGETVNQFTNRVRLEKAARRLRQNQGISITEVALDLGFASSSSFARAFQANFGMSASAWRKDALLNSKISQIQSRIGKAGTAVDLYLDQHTQELVEERVQTMKALDITVKTLEPRNVAYVRSTGDFQKTPEIFGETWGKLMSWAGPRGLIAGAETLCMFHDDPDVTDSDLMRFSSCITLDRDVDVSGEVGKMSVAGGKYAYGHFKIAHHESQAAWEVMFGEWLPTSGYEPENKPCFQLYPNMSSGMEKQDVYICIPVLPL
ncbi:GyrI-like domain-containing protein [Pseudovibrio sp. Tun.PSC04-5.I4]|uniref:AraC family transcriptional regulator n=1 Tax=Pseudovibrio sp. Tun.PSC04-5.I4 TaxID=1798213 RepID=UPI000889413A|nr:GyrI-like domain-containing protein [Pseudovibrio sp. Tun.PSC04-5.I4]SDQ86879.1 AraC family transcriptional regulator [Pseudovibrio sp. Tun.PSC04-5.I4]